MPAKDALGNQSVTVMLDVGRSKHLGIGDILADKVSIALLAIVQSLEVLLNLEPDHGRRLVGEVVSELLSVHGGRKSLMVSKRSRQDEW